MKKLNYKVVAYYNGERKGEVVGRFSDIDRAVKRQKSVFNELPLSAIDEYITVVIETINHRKKN